MGSTVNYIRRCVRNEAEACGKAFALTDPTAFREAVYRLTTTIRNHGIAFLDHKAVGLIADSSALESAIRRGMKSTSAYWSDSAVETCLEQVEVEVVRQISIQCPALRDIGIDGISIDALLGLLWRINRDIAAAGNDEVETVRMLSSPFSKLSREQKHRLAMAALETGDDIVTRTDGEPDRDTAIGMHALCAVARACVDATSRESVRRLIALDDMTRLAIRGASHTPPRPNA